MKSSNSTKKRGGLPTAILTGGNSQMKSNCAVGKPEVQQT